MRFKGYTIQIFYSRGTVDVCSIIDDAKDKIRFTALLWKGDFYLRLYYLTLLRILHNLLLSLNESTCTYTISIGPPYLKFCCKGNHSFRSCIFDIYTSDFLLFQLIVFFDIIHVLKYLHIFKLQQMMGTEANSLLPYLNSSSYKNSIKTVLHSIFSLTNW